MKDFELEDNIIIEEEKNDNENEIKNPEQEVKQEEEKGAKKEEIKYIPIDYKDWDMLQDYDYSAEPVIPNDEDIQVDEKLVSEAIDKAKTRIIDSKIKTFEEDNLSDKKFVKKLDEARDITTAWEKYDKTYREGPGLIEKTKKEIVDAYHKLPRGLMYEKSTKKAIFPEQESKLNTHDVRVAIRNYNKKVGDLTQFQIEYNASVESKKIITDKQYQKAKKIVEDYDKKVEGQKQIARQVAEAAAKFEGDKFIKKYKENYKKNVVDQFNKEKADRFQAREDIELKDRQNYLMFVESQKKAGKASFVQTAEQVNVYNSSISRVVNEVKENSLDEVFMLGAYKKLPADSFDVEELSDKDLRDAEQVFDRMFVGVEAFYNRHKVDESVLKNTQLVNARIKELSPEEATALKGKSVEDVVAKILEKKGIKKEEIAPDKFSQYAKAFYLHSIGHQQVSLKFVPGTYKMGDNGPEKQFADNDAQYTIETEKIIYTNNAEAQEKQAFINRGNAPRYKRVKAEDMIAHYPLKQNNEAIKDEDALLVNENILKAKEDSIKARLNEFKTNKEAKKAVFDKLVEVQKIRRLDPMPVLDQETLNAHKYWYREHYARDGRINISALYDYVDVIHKFALSYPKYSELYPQLTEALAAFNLAKQSGIKNTLNCINGNVLEYTDQYTDQDLTEKALNAYAIAKSFEEAIKLNNDRHSEAGNRNQANEDMYDIITTHFDFMHQKNINSLLQYDPTYIISFRALISSFPYNSFRNEKGDYEPNDARYNEMMSRIPFIKNIKERQEFIKEKNTIVNRVNDKVKYDKDIRDLHDHYIKLANSTKRDISLFKNLDVNQDEYITTSKAFRKDAKTLIHMNYGGARNGDIVNKELNKKLYLIDHGWPVEDTAFISELTRVEKELTTISRGGNNITNRQKTEAKQILEQFKEPLEKVRKSIVASEDIRDALLDSLKEPLNRFVNLKEAMQPGNEFIQDLYKESANRRIMASHMGGADHRVLTGYAEIELPGENQVQRLPYKKPALTNEQIKENIDYMVKDLNAVEMIKRGSPEFYEMKQSLLRLQAYARGPLNDINEDNMTGTYDALVSDKQKETKEMLLDTIRRTKEYLDHKQDDFNRDNRRRDDPSKETREQKRIHMAINQLEKLSFLLGVYEDVDKSRAIERIDQKIEAETQALANAENKNDYMRAASRLLVLNSQKKDSYYKPRNNETQQQYWDRINSLGRNDLSSNDIAGIIQNDAVLRELILAEENSYGTQDFKKPTAAQLLERFNDRIGDKRPDSYSTQIDYPVTDDAKKVRADEIKAYKTNLVSTERQNRKATHKQSKEAGTAHAVPHR